MRKTTKTVSREEHRRRKDRINCMVAAACLAAMLLLIGAAALGQSFPSTRKDPTPACAADQSQNGKTDPEHAAAASEDGGEEMETGEDPFRPEVPLDRREQELLRAACDEFGVEPALMLALMEQESGFQNVTGDGGRSVGYCQIQQRWWAGLMEQIGASDLSRPEDNFRTACAILVDLGGRYHTLTDVLTAYNTGSGGQSQYAQRILERMEAWR